MGKVIVPMTLLVVAFIMALVAVVFGFRVSTFRGVAAVTLAAIGAGFLAVLALLITPLV